LCRWTDGDALLPPVPNAIFVEIHLAGRMPYRVDPPEPIVSTPGGVMHPCGVRAA
jgi:hypothetical protein